MKGKKEVGKLRWLEYNKDTKELSILIDIIDEDFKKEILQHRDSQSIIEIKGKDLIKIST